MRCPQRICESVINTPGRSAEDSGRYSIRHSFVIGHLSFVIPIFSAPKYGCSFSGMQIEPSDC